MPDSNSSQAETSSESLSQKSETENAFVRLASFIKNEQRKLRQSENPKFKARSDKISKYKSCEELGSEPENIQKGLQLNKAA